MPKSLTQYQVFIASPSGLDEERKHFRQKLVKFTDRYAEPLGVVFRPVGWEDLVGGPGRPQQAINDALKECDYAVFILHDRWGSSPGSDPYTSGVEEEWYLTEDLHRSQKIRSIALFFKDITNESQFNDPGSQLQAVIAFRKQIEKSKEHFYKRYRTINEFDDYLESHLAKWLRDGPPSFRIDEVKPSPPLEPKRVIMTPAPPLGVLANFHGEFAGHGFNLIFRPNSGPPTGTTFPNPVAGPAIPTPPNENVLELNLTTEMLSFSSALGNVPNHGLQGQSDIFLNGVPYVQAINDVTNPATGKGDGPPTGIHFEPGLWMHIPQTKTPVLAASLVRMASIPHGTTINAQGLAPTASIWGAPTIPPVDITPFVIGKPGTPIRFASQTAASINTPRIPQDLSKFIASGTITQAILDDPNTILRQAIAGQNIVETFVFTVSTSPSGPEFGGGTTNIAFLEGDVGLTEPNGYMASMTATYWVETLEHRLLIPSFKAGSPPLAIKAPATRPDQLTPTFQVSPPRDIPSPISITVRTIQIQYSQIALINFGGLTWPNVSVATLTPSKPQVVPPSAWQT